jgi:hypothetical protein
MHSCKILLSFCCTITLVGCTNLTVYTARWPLLANPTIQPRWYERGEGASYAIVQHSPSCMRVAAARSGHMRTQWNSKVGVNYYVQRKKIRGQGKLNLRPQLWYHVRRHLLCQPTIKPRWYGRGEGASYAIVQQVWIVIKVLLPFFNCCR